MNRKQFRLLRQSADLTQRKLADLMGVSYAYICQIETGARPLLPHIERRFREICKVTIEREIMAKELTK